MGRLRRSLYVGRSIEYLFFDCFGGMVGDGDVVCLLRCCKLWVNVEVSTQLVGRELGPFTLSSFRRRISDLPPSVSKHAIHATSGAQEEFAAVLGCIRYLVQTQSARACRLRFHGEASWYKLRRGGYCFQTSRDMGGTRLRASFQGVQAGFQTAK